MGLNSILINFFSFLPTTPTFQKPIPFIYSPFGPMGQLRGYLMYGGSKILDIYDYLVKVKGFSSLIAWWILSVIVLTIGVFMIITIGLITIPRDKQD